MTLEEYLLTIDADYEAPGGKIKVFFNPPTLEQIGSAGGLPYAMVEGLDENPRAELYGNQAVVDQVVDVALYQEPAADGTTPDRKKLFAVWHKVQDAVHNVNENTFGRSFVSFHRGPALEPRRDTETKGLFATVRFRLVSARG